MKRVRKRAGEFDFLSDEEVLAMETAVRTAYGDQRIAPR
jgi:hypothetical protein